MITWIFDEGTFRPSAKLVGEKRYSIITDYLGTPTQMFDEQGELSWEADYDIYGKIRKLHVGSLGDCPFRYQGQYEDVETGLYYNRFRYYSPDTGTYVSQDPIGLASGEPNFYTYVHDSNVWVDSLGLAALFQLGTYGSLNGVAHVGDNLQAHELIRHEYLHQQGLATKGGRLSGNPSIALDNVHHTRRGGAHWHEAQIRRSQGLGRNQFHTNLKRELDITQGGLRKAGVPASRARRLRKESEKFYKKLKKGCR